MRKTATLAALAAVGMTLTGCGASLPKAEAERLVLDYGQHHCQMTVLYTNTELHAAMWLRPRPVEASLYRFVEQQGAALGSTVVDAKMLGGGVHMARYRASDGWDFYMEDTYNTTDDAIRGVITNVQGCMYRPTSVDIVDVTVNKETGKQATAILKWPTEEPTVFAKALLSSDVAPQLDAALLQPHPEQEYTASLEKLDEGGWRVTNLTARGS